MHVYRNRRYEEEIIMLLWHCNDKEGEQRMVETVKQKTQIQAPEAHHKIAESAPQTHTIG
jgi:hypothetical protein